MSDFKITEPGFYRLRNGKKAWVAAKTPFHYSDPRVWVGQIEGTHCYSVTWTESGKYYADRTDNEDVVAVWRDPVRVSGWVNVYSSGDLGCIWPTKEQAEAGARPVAHACIYLSGEEGVVP